MLHLALNAYKTVSVRELSALTFVSPKYLEQMLSALRAAGLVRSIRGARGGYRLARHAGLITLRNIYEVFEGTAGFVDCTSSPELCSQADSCITRDVWDQLYNSFSETLGAITIQELVSRAKEPSGPTTPVETSFDPVRDSSASGSTLSQGARSTE